MSRRVNQIQYEILAIMLVAHLYGMALYRNASFAFQLHVVQHLILQIFARNRVGIFQQPVGKRAFAMVDMRDYTKIPNMIHLIFFSWGKDNANRAQNRQTCLSDYAEMQLIFCKDNANRAQKI